LVGLGSVPGSEPDEHAAVVGGAREYVFAGVLGQVT
jgi:hypothetical protein